MTHKLTLASGAVHDVPPGVTIDTEWKAKKDARDLAASQKELAEMQAEWQALKDAGYCVHCKQPLPAKEEV